MCLVTGLFCLMIGLFWRRRRERENDDAAIDAETDAVTDAVTDASAPDDIQIPISSYIQLKNKIKKIHQQDEHNPSLCEKIRLCKKIPLVTIESRSSPKSRPSHGLVTVVAHRAKALNGGGPLAVDSRCCLPEVRTSVKRDLCI